MADYLVTGEQMTAIADAIRANTGSSAGVVFPEGFTSTVSEMMHFSHSDRATICKKLVEWSVGSIILNDGTCRVYVNDTDMVDEYGIPARSFATVVGYYSSIIYSYQKEAQAIYDVKPDGLSAYGSTKYTINDESIGLYPATKYELTIEATAPGSITDNESEKMQNNIKEYVAALGIGEDAVCADILAACNNGIEQAKYATALKIKYRSKTYTDRYTVDWKGFCVADIVAIAKSAL